jgi:DNA-binding PadR family transcriptional regulator
VGVLPDVLEHMGAEDADVPDRLSGSIKRDLDMLLAQGFIEATSAQPGVRGKKVYRVTDAGRSEFRSWMSGELGGPNVETAALSRLYFLGLLEPAERPPVLQRITTRIAADHARLASLNERLSAIDVAEPDRDIATFQLATLHYGIASHRFALDWFRDHLDRADGNDPLR